MHVVGGVQEYDSRLMDLLEPDHVVLLALDAFCFGKHMRACVAMQRVAANVCFAFSALQRRSLM
jgi:hypothetical protein